MKCPVCGKSFEFAEILIHEKYLVNEDSITPYDKEKNTIFSLIDVLFQLHNKDEWKAMSVPIYQITKTIKTLQELKESR